jgi:hypothetical protein
MLGPITGTSKIDSKKDKQTSNLKSQTRTCSPTEVSKLLLGPKMGTCSFAASSFKTCWSVYNKQLTRIAECCKQL